MEDAFPATWKLSFKAVKGRVFSFSVLTDKFTAYWGSSWYFGSKDGDFKSEYFLPSSFFKFDLKFFTYGTYTGDRHWISEFSGHRIPFPFASYKVTVKLLPFIRRLRLGVPALLFSTIFWWFGVNAIWFPLFEWLCMNWSLLSAILLYKNPMII